jgi:hypothetical protein
MATVECTGRRVLEALHGGPSIRSNPRPCARSRMDDFLRARGLREDHTTPQAGLWLATTAHGFWYGVDAGMQYADQSIVISVRV